ncbi:MAG: hypothetical protein AABZ08_05300 [Planctomycetota bacterium]
MSRSFNLVVFKSKAVLCLVLTLTCQVMLPGCGLNGISLLSGAEQLRVSLPADHPLRQALEGSPFRATAIDIFPTTQQFSLVLVDKTQKLSGKYAFVDGQFTIAEFFVINRGKSATLIMDGNKRVSRMITSDGSEWKLPVGSERIDAPTVDGVDAYLQANTMLLDVAQRMDDEIAAGAVTPTPQPVPIVSLPAADPTTPKATASYDDPLRAALLVISGIWFPLIGILPALLALFSVSAVLQSALVLRFDGTWMANNANSELQVSISGGKIIRLVDPSSGQEIGITDSKLESVSGNRVVWTVDTNILGQGTPVNFEFDVKELANGSLEGTLTTLGANLARVPLTMARVQG